MRHYITTLLLLLTLGVNAGVNAVNVVTFTKNAVFTKTQAERKAAGKLGARLKKLVPKKVRLKAPKKIVIGENIERVGPYAEKIGAEVYEALPGFKPGMEAEGLADNMRVIQQKMAEGYEIIDIGPDFPRRAVWGVPQPAYQMERTITKGYEGYRKAFIRTSKTSLVLPEP